MQRLTPQLTDTGGIHVDELDRLRALLEERRRLVQEVYRQDQAEGRTSHTTWGRIDGLKTAIELLDWIKTHPLEEAES